MTVDSRGPLILTRHAVAASGTALPRWNAEWQAKVLGQVVETDPKPKGTLDVRTYSGNPVPNHPSVSARDQNTAGHPSRLPLS